MQSLPSFISGTAQCSTTSLPIIQSTLCSSVSALTTRQASPMVDSVAKSSPRDSPGTTSASGDSRLSRREPVAGLPLASAHLTGPELQLLLAVLTKSLGTKVQPGYLGDTFCPSFQYLC